VSVTQRSRYVVRVTHGWLSMESGHGGGSRPQASAYVLDRLNAWRVVDSFRSEQQTSYAIRDTLGVGGAIEAAQAKADFLNRWDGQLSGDEETVGTLELARELGVSRRVITDLCLRLWPRRGPGGGSSWRLAPDQVEEIREHLA
jgi:hypothetical protein